jgi:hypothetical protein
MGRFMEPVIHYNSDRSVRVSVVLQEGDFCLSQLVFWKVFLSIKLCKVVISGITV